MKSALRFSSRLYSILLQQYPPEFRASFASEMAQVFQLACRAAYETEGQRGLIKLWIGVGWDWLRSVAYEWWASLFNQRSSAMDINAFEHQFGDMVWVITTGLRAGYSLKQVFEVLAENAPEPAASVCKRLVTELNKGTDFGQALEKWKQAVPSPYLTRMIDQLLAQRLTGGNITDRLEPLGAEVRQKFGSDGSFDAMMREQAEKLQAKLPEHLRLT